jgi:hypothetical protein
MPTNDSALRKNVVTVFLSCILRAKAKYALRITEAAKTMTDSGKAGRKFSVIVYVITFGMTSICDVCRRVSDLAHNRHVWLYRLLSTIGS